MQEIIDVLHNSLKNNNISNGYKLVPTNTYSLGDVIVFLEFKPTIIYKVVENWEHGRFLVVIAPKETATKCFKLDGGNENGIFEDSLLKLNPHKVKGRLTIEA